jgi:hypothetical protein
MGCIEAWLPCGPGDVEEIYVAESRALWEILLPRTLTAVMRRRDDLRILNEVNVDFIAKDRAMRTAQHHRNCILPLECTFSRNDIWAP